MINLVIVKNPFEPWRGREVHTVPAGFTIRQAVNLTEFKGIELNCTVNGNTVELDENTVIPDNNIVVLSPRVAGGGGGGKSIIGLVAMVALAAVSFGVGGLAAGSAGIWGTGAAVAHWGWASYAAAAGVLFLGSKLVNRCFAAKDTAPKYKNSEATYSWSGVQTMEGQNNAIAVTYGKVKSGGQTIGKFLNSDGNKEYLNWLVSAGEGPLEITDITLNDNEASYYKGVDIETRPGTNDQEVISNFNDTYATKGLNRHLVSEPAIERSEGNAAEGFIVRLEWPAGLVHNNSKGKQESTWVKISGWYRKAGQTDDDWIQFMDRVNYHAKKTSAIRREVRVDHLEPAMYEVKLQVVDREYSVNNAKTINKVYWTGLTSIVYDDFAYPNIALLSIKALATDQLNGSPHLTFIKERKWVWVWNPDTEMYEEKPANNPAWAAYDMLHQCQRLKNVNTGEYEFEVRGASTDILLYDQFKSWADFCAEKNLTINIEISSTGELLEVINGNIANCGRGMVIRYGTRYGCIWDSVKQPVQMFGMGNIKKGSFTEEFTQTSDRANCVEVTFTNAEHDYEREVIMIYGDNYDNDPEEKTAQVTYDGITNYEQAYREGVYQLMANKLQLRTISFEADIDAIACTIGDVVLVAHDVPQWAYSGRIYSVNTSKNTLRLPIEVKDTAQRYRIMYRTVNDTRISSSVTITSNANGWCDVKVDDVFNPNDLPQAGDIFDLAIENIGSKPFLIQSITKSQDFTRRLNCVEYVEALYAEDYSVPPVEYSMAINNKAQNVTGLNANQVSYVTEDGTRASRLYVSWNHAPNGGTYSLLYSTDKEFWSLLQSGLYENSFEADVAYGESYYLKVITTLGLSKSTGTEYGPVEVGEDLIPPDVTALDVEVLADGTRRYFWGFEYPDPNDIAGFKIRYSQGEFATWQSGYDVQDGLITSQPYETTTVRQGPHTVMIKAVDNGGNESENCAFCRVDFGEPLENNVLFKHDFSANNWAECETNGEIFSDGFVHAHQVSYAWTSAQNGYWGASENDYWYEQYSEFYLQASLLIPASGYFYLLFDIEGPCNLEYKNLSSDDLFKPYSTKVYVSAGDNIVIRFNSQPGMADTVLKALTAVVDVPDKEEHFSNLQISKTGTELPIKTNPYQTTAVHFDKLRSDLIDGYVNVERVSDVPCIVKVYRLELQGGVMVKNYIDCTADITWQGFKVETNE